MLSETQLTGDGNDRRLLVRDYDEGVAAVAARKKKSHGRV